jgi:general secretion pathway protein K
LQMADARRLVTVRANKHLTSLSDVSEATGQAQIQTVSTLHGVASSFFEIGGQLRIGQTTVQEISVVQRSGAKVTVLWRTRGVAASSPPLQ